MKINFHHVCIETSDYEASVKFYCELMGFEMRKEETGFHGRNFNSWLANGDVLIELQTPKEGVIPAADLSSDGTGLKHLCFLVDDLDESVDELLGKGHENFKRKGGNIIYPVLGGRLCKVIAPEGTVIELREDGDI